LILAVLSLIGPASAFSQTSSDTDAAVDQAKRDYKVFLEQLKSLNSQYKHITNEITEVVKEEGVPIIDEDTGEMKMIKPGDPEWGGPSIQDNTASVFGDADIRETDREMIVKVDLPGVDKNNIQLKIENDRLLRIRAERREEREGSNFSQDVRYRRIERQHGMFERVIELPVDAKENGSPEASYENGVLTVRIQKAVETRKEVSIPIR